MSPLSFANVSPIFRPLRSHKFINLLKKGGCLNDTYIVRARILSTETSLRIWKQQIVTDGQFRKIWRKWDQFVSHFVKFRHCDYTRGTPYIVLVKEHFFLEQTLSFLLKSSLNCAMSWHQLIYLENTTCDPKNCRLDFVTDLFRPPCALETHCMIAAWSDVWW